MSGEDTEIRGGVGISSTTGMNIYGGTITGNEAAILVWRRYGVYMTGGVVSASGNNAVAIQCYDSSPGEAPAFIDYYQNVMSNVNTIAGNVVVKGGTVTASGSGSRAIVTAYGDITISGANQ